MASRVRDDVQHLFFCFCEIVHPETAEKEAWVIQKYPESYNDEHILKTVPKFAYPCEIENATIQHYSFVLTSLDSKWTFGFCRHDPKTETALVFLSYLPWHEEFIKLLNVVGELIHNSESGQLWKFLDLVYDSKIPDPGATLTVPYNNDTKKYVCQSPALFQLPRIPENRNLTEYYNAVDVRSMLIIFASMLNERRIIFTSKRLYRLSACVQSANAVLYPMHWQHIYIPVLPQHLTDYLLAPMPFLIGVPTPVLEKVRKSDLGEVVILDADTCEIETPFDDVLSLPQEVLRFLKTQLKNRSALLGDGVSRAFLRALVILIGGYRDALKFHQGQEITFCRTSFIESRPVSMQPFLRKMLQLQIFQQFIEERLNMLNAGLGFSDEFELEACNYSDKSSSKIKAQYKEWTVTMKSQGSAFFKTVKSKANPAMKSAVKSVRERSKEVKTAYKGIKSKMKKDEDDENVPRSVPASPTGHRTRPATFAGNKELTNSVTASYRKQRRTTAHVNRTKEYSPLSPSSDEAVSPREEDVSAAGTLPNIDMDLMGDLQDVIFRKCSLFDETNDSPVSSPVVDRTLKPMRSFDSANNPQITCTAGVATPRHQQRSDVAKLDFLNRTHHPSLMKPALSLPSTNNLLPHHPLLARTHAPPATTNSSLPRHPLVTDPFGFSNHRPPVSHNNNNIHNKPAPILAKPDSVTNGDLIALDEDVDEEIFDPLSSKSRNDTDKKFHVGLTNPLYPYYKIKNTSNTKYRKEEDKMSTTNSVTNTQDARHDIDLLKEYGIVFNTTNTTSNGLFRNNQILDPFEVNFNQNNTAGNWTTFD